MSLAEELNRKIHGGIPFADVGTPERAPDPTGWLIFEEVLDQVIDFQKPEIIIEVGTWKGASALHMARRAAQHRQDFAVICIDTWLGSAVHWLDTDYRVQLQCRPGYPTLYETFLSNVVSAGLAERIVPLPLSSDQAVLVLEALEITAPVIYIDAGHDLEAVRADMERYWKRLRPRGIMVGDDHLDCWPGVVEAFAVFCQDHAGEIANHEVVGNKWILRKN